MRLSSVLRKSSIVVAALAVAAVATESFVRAYYLEDGSYWGGALAPFGVLDEDQRTELGETLRSLDAWERERFFRIFDAELGWTHRPGIGGDGTNLVINSSGARGAREYAPEPPEGVLRVACYGESFVYGSEVRAADSWPAQLEGLDPALEALNFGVPAYGTDQALLRFRRKGRHGARVVVIGYMLENLCRNVNRYRPLYSPDEWFPYVKPRFVLEPELVLVRFPYASQRSLIQAALAGDVQAHTRGHEYWAGDEPLLPFSVTSRLITTRYAHGRRRYADHYADPTAEPFAVTVALLETFYREALASGAERAVVLVFGKREDVGHLDDGDRYWDPLLAALDERGIPTLDLLAELHARRGADDLFTSAHLSAAGNRVVAERVRRWLVE